MIFSFLEEVPMPERIEIGVTHWDHGYARGIRRETMFNIAENLFTAGLFEDSARAYKSLSETNTDGFVRLPTDFMVLVTNEDCPKMVLLVGESCREAIKTMIPYDPEKHKK